MNISFYSIHANYPDLMDAHHRQNLRLPQRSFFTLVSGIRCYIKKDRISRLPIR